MKASKLRKGSLVRPKFGHIACLYTDRETGKYMLQIVRKELSRLVFSGKRYVDPILCEKKQLLYIGFRKNKFKKKHMFFVDTKCVELVNRECRHLELCEKKI